MRMIAILIFAMTTSRIFAGKYTALSDSVSSKVDAKRPQILPFNFTNGANTQQRFRKYDVSAAIRTMKDVLNRTKVMKPMFIVPSKQLPQSRIQTLRLGEASKKWKRKKLRKRLMTFWKHNPDDLVPVGTNARQMGGANLAKANDTGFEASLQFRKNLNDRIKASFSKRRTLHLKERVLKSYDRLSHTKQINPEQLRNEINSKQFLQQSEDSLSKVSTDDMAGRKSMGAEMSLGLKSVAAQLIVKCRRTSRKGKSLSYNKCHRRIRKVLKKISEQEALRQDRRIGVVSLLNRSKRQVKSTNKSDKEQDDTDAENATALQKQARVEDESELTEPADESNRTDELKEKEGKLVGLMMDYMFGDVVSESKKYEEEEKKEIEKLKKKWDEKFEQIKADISNAMDIKTTINAVSRSVNDTEEHVEQNRFAAAELLPPPPPQPPNIIGLILRRRKTTTMATCKPDMTLYSLVIGFIVCIVVIICGIFAVIGLNKTAADRGEQQRLIIFRKEPRRGASEEPSRRGYRGSPRRRRHSREFHRQSNRRRRPSPTSTRQSNIQSPVTRTQQTNEESPAVQSPERPVSTPITTPTANPPNQP